MVDPRIEKLAKLCIHYSVDVKPEETVLIQGSELAFPLINEMYKECFFSDAHPMLRANYSITKFTKNMLFDEKWVEQYT